MLTKRVGWFLKAWKAKAAFVGIYGWFINIHSHASQIETFIDQRLAIPTITLFPELQIPGSGDEILKRTGHSRGLWSVDFQRARRGAETAAWSGFGKMNPREEAFPPS